MILSISVYDLVCQSSVSPISDTVISNVSNKCLGAYSIAVLFAIFFHKRCDVHLTVVLTVFPLLNSAAGLFHFGTFRCGVYFKNQNRRK